ncbi:DUF4426 domain-containing protein [Brumicola blandensis]|uniref:DUF4426 domain-containing protein n=1 Tax=Brumicola blandensis TaxID=3075611 RepID=A0AAW8R570_9ALTE|nr:DUF4426 domain-containing protein [Alteromonas sp. W409]MDT0583208.1 DUF4426 domain-containing protein [Alteromonas sp. W409]
MRVLNWSFLVVVCLGLLLPSVSHAEQKKTLGQWDVHYIVLDTTFLTPEIAKANQIVRSKYNALVNISVLDKDTQEAQNLSVTGSARNLLGSKIDLNFKKVVDGKAIYYLAVLSHDHRETFRFEVTVQQGNKQEVLKFQEELYVN